MNEPFVFVSYRRSDTTPYALALKAELEHRLRSAFVFVDIERIQATDRWPEILDNALTRARVLILMIGTRWIECEDCAERPRLFDKNDWVRKEAVSILLKNPLSILPVLVDGAKMPLAHELPADMAEIANIQALRLDTTHWQQCVDSLCRILVNRFAFQLSDPRPRNPGRSAFRGLTPLLEESALERAVKQFLVNWRIENLYDRNEYATLSQWLVRTFDFPSFGTAIQFLQQGAIACEKLNHHPNWENCFKQVTVRITTWNAGHRITQYDIDLARRLDRIAADLSKSASTE